MHENIAREDINPIDWATHLEYLKKTFKLTNADMAKRLGFSEAWVAQHLEILNYPAEVLQAIQNGQLAFTAARELAQIKDNVKRQIYVNAAVRSGVTPAQAANWRREANTPNYQAPENTGPENAGEQSGGVALALPICAVCSEDIDYSDLLTLQIHRNCAPQQS